LLVPAARGFKICLELLVRTTPRTVVEVPYAFVGRAAGTSKMSLREVLGFLKQLWDLHRFDARLKSGRPTRLVLGGASSASRSDEREPHRQRQGA
jgi:hypothetical protein